MSTWAIVLSGFAGTIPPVVESLLALRECGVSYPILTVEVNENGRDAIEMISMSSGTEGTAQEISLPPLEQILDNWLNIINHVSKRMPGVAVTVVVNGVLQASLNGQLL